MDMLRSKIGLFALLALMFSHGTISSAADDAFIPVPFAEIDGVLIQEFTSVNAQAVSDGYVLFSEPTDACVIEVNDTIDISLFLDRHWNKIIYVGAVRDEDGIRRRALFGGFAGPFSEATGITFDPLRRDEDTCWVWPIFVADKGNNRVVELNLRVHKSLRKLPSLEVRRNIGAGYLVQPADVAFCGLGCYLYVAHKGQRPIVGYYTRHPGDAQLVTEFGEWGNGAYDFSNPVSIHYDAVGGSWPAYLYVCDPGNSRIACLAICEPGSPHLGWENTYTEPGFRPISVTSYQGCGVYVLNEKIGDPQIVVLDPRVMRKLATYRPESMLHSRGIYLRECEAGIINEYTQSTGFAYYLLDAKIYSIQVSPNPFDPLETHTLISYTVSGYGDLTIRIYDSSWRPKRTLVDSLLISSGAHWEWWDGRDDSGALLPAGNYHIVASLWDYAGDGLPDVDTIDVRIEGVPIRVLTSGLWVRDPAWSNRGDKIAFASAALGDWANGIWVVNLSESQSPVRLTDSGDLLFDTHPDWSPTDDYLVFQRSETYSFGMETLSDDALSKGLMEGVRSWGVSRIYRIRSDGQDLTPLSVGNQKYDWHPSWSPYLTTDAGPPGDVSGRIAFWGYQDHQLWTMRATDGGDRKMITSGTDSIGSYPLPDMGYCSWSPDGQWIAFQTHGYDAVGIWKIDVQTGSYSLLHEEPSWGTVSGISWSPSGSTIAYEIADSDSLATGIKGISSEGAFEVGYILKNMYGYGFDWSPDGTKLAFVVMDSGHPSLAIADFRRDERAFPAANIISPVSGEIVEGTVIVTFQVGDNISVDGETVLSALESFSLEWGYGREPLVWSTRGIALIPGDSIAIWETSDLPEGIYTIRLCATDGVDRNIDKVWVRVCGGTSGAKPGSIPPKLEVSRALPNPFMVTTRLRVGAPYRGNLKVDIYNCLGELVRVMMHSAVEAGWKELEWDGKNELGNVCSPGIYLWRVSFENETRVVRVVLLR